MRVVLSSPHFEEREQLHDRTGPLESFSPNCWEDCYIQAFLREGHEVTTGGKELPDDEFEVGLFFLPRKERKSEEFKKTEISLFYEMDPELFFLRDVKKLPDPDQIDYLLVNPFFMTSAFKKQGYKAFYLPFASFPEVQRSVFSGEYESDLFFAGKANEANYKDRLEYLERLEKEKDLKTDFYLRSSARADMPFSYVGHLEKMKRAKFTFHKEADGKRVDSIDLRPWESLGSGSCLFTNSSREVKMVFGEDKLVQYSSYSDLLSKIRKLLNDPERRENIGKGGQEFVFEHHTYRDRVGQIEDIIEEKTEEWYRKLKLEAVSKE